jgi:hypothetical protein
MLWIQTFTFSGFIEGGRVIPARGTRFGIRARFFEKYADSGGSAAKRGGNSGSQTVTGGSTDHQHAGRAVLDFPVLLHIFDLLFHVDFAASRMGRCTDESTNFWFDYHNDG